MTEIFLHGVLAKKFNNYFKFANITKIIDAVSAIDSQRNGFKNFILMNVSSGKNFEFIVNGESLKTQEEALNIKTIKTIDIVPVIGGSGKMIATMFFNFFLNTLLSTQGFQAVINPPENIESVFAGSENESFMFTSQDNVASQGSSVPLGYGLLRIGSKIISTDIDTYDAATFDYRSVSDTFGVGASPGGGGGGY